MRQHHWQSEELTIYQPPHLCRCGKGLAASREEDKVAFQVTDTGIGLPPEQLAHIFERFYRVDKSRSRAFGGSGIGLTIAQSLARAMGGDIRVASAGLGQGSSFTLTLPQASE